MSGEQNDAVVVGQNALVCGVTFLLIVGSLFILGIGMIITGGFMASEGKDQEAVSRTLLTLGSVLTSVVTYIGLTACTTAGGILSLFFIKSCIDKKAQNIEVESRTLVGDGTSHYGS